MSVGRAARTPISTTTNRATDSRTFFLVPFFTALMISPPSLGSLTGLLKKNLPGRVIFTLPGSSSGRPSRSARFLHFLENTAAGRALVENHVQRLHRPVACCLLL